MPHVSEIPKLHLTASRPCCWPGWTICLVLALAFSAAASAKIDLPGPEHLVKVEGVVVAPDGEPLAGVEITLTQDEKVAFQTQTDASGKFSFEHVSGHFVFHVARTKFAPAAREIVVRDELVTRVERKKLYVVVGPGACADECSSIFTNESDFKKALKIRNKR